MNIEFIVNTILNTVGLPEVSSETVTTILVLGIAIVAFVVISFM